ncbi:hypothetical protein KC333_g221 [Hortaea werneckii]|nr:hypothetical protein KC333_g221 [Hortaea werneckii]
MRSPRPFADLGSCRCPIGQAQSLPCCSRIRLPRRLVAQGSARLPAIDGPQITRLEVSFFELIGRIWIGERLKVARQVVKSLAIVCRLCKAHSDVDVQIGSLGEERSCIGRFGDISMLEQRRQFIWIIDKVAWEEGGECCFRE